jgi:hypothetical protein
MRSPLPTTQDIDELVSFLARIYARGFEPIDRWGGGTKDERGVLTMPWPEYNSVVIEFFNAASRECWCDYDYVPEEVGRSIVDNNFIKRASLNELKTLLTYCVRGERFCDGHWAAMIQEGRIKALLERLRDIKPTMPNKALPADHAKRRG